VAIQQNNGLREKAMSYISGFDYDIFISYAHVDNATADEGETGWVTAFREHLDVQLSKRVGRIGAVKVWQDPKLEGGQLFDQTIKNSIDRAALFLALTSTGYLASDYCRQEVKWFTEKASAESLGLAVGDRMRVFNLQLNNIPFPDWPTEFGRTSGFPFHDAEETDDLGYPSDPKDRLFQQQIRKLVDAVYRTLLVLKEKQVAAAPAIVSAAKAPEKSPADDAFTVFLADTSDTLRTLRRRVSNELQQEGIRVTSNLPPPYDSSSHEAAAINAINQAHLSIHLLDGVPGREIEGQEEKTYPRRHAELGLEHARSQMIWVPQSLDPQAIEDSAYRTFIHELENGARDESGYNFIRESPSNITREVLDRIKQLQTAAKPVAEPLSALIDTHFKDQMHALDLIRFFTDRNVRPFINPEEDDPRKNIHILEERLKQVTRLIIVFGEVTADWVRERLNAAVQIAITERCPLKAFGIYFAGERRKDADANFNFGFLPVFTFDNSDLQSPQTIAPFLEER